MNFRPLRPIGLIPLLVASLVGLVAVPFDAIAAERAIEREVVVPATLDQAWAAWTTREGITSFFSPGAEIDARVGGAFHIFMDPSAAPGERGADDMRYMALQPMKMISFDWNAPPSLPEARAQRTFVIVRFEPVGDKQTRVTLHHTGWGTGGQWDQTYAYFDKAWPRVLDNLRKRFESGPMDWAPWLAQLKAYKDKAAAEAAASAPGK
ncbi:SRPBCC domain-containing protein [Ideonella sp.]|uniref:SRPBCC family protein n=1 Tax=Ideonella sp. TaxID=1929293 RepID=UPI0035B10CD4